MNLRILFLMFVSLSFVLVGCGPSGSEVGTTLNQEPRPTQAEFQHGVGGVGVVVSHEAVDYGTIREVTPGGPADKAGLKVGDKVVTVNGKTMVEVPHALRGDPGTQVEVIVIRNGQTITANMVRVALKPNGH